MSAHYDEGALQEYLDDPDSFAGRVELESHVTLCESCGALLDELRAFESTLASDAVWEAAKRPPEEPPDAIRALAELLTAEDRDGERLLAPLLASPASFRRANVTSMPWLRTAGVVRRLSRESRELRERQPMHALVVADAAIALADQLPHNRYPTALLHDLRGSAWLERANVLRYLGRYADALDAVDRAAKSFARSPAAVFSFALLDYLRGVVFIETEKLDDALRLMRKCARVFRQFGEEDRFIHAKMLEATILFDQHRMREASDLFVSLIPSARSIGSVETLARLYSNIANCQVQLHELHLAADYYRRALSIYKVLGLETERIRAQWNMATLSVANGEIAEGLARLRESAQEFESIGLRSDAALVTLDLAEVLLAGGERAAAREAADLCRSLVDKFAEVGMTGHALTALAFLREAFDRGQASPTLVKHVRHYLETRPDQTGRPFIPPDQP